MRLMAGAVLVVFATALIWEWKAGATAQAQSSQGVAVREPVVVELFTSEGCSSCPPADALLAELQNRQPLGNAEIIALEEHVTYWDDLGWKDPFSSPTWTTRQYDYATALHNGNPYTPEMVVDGTAEFVGSRGSTARQEIEKAAGTRKARVEISEVSPMQNNSVAFRISVEKLLSVCPQRHCGGYSRHHGEWAALFSQRRRERRKRIAAFAGVTRIESDRGNREERSGRFRGATYRETGFQMEHREFARRRFCARKKEPADPGSRGASPYVARLTSR